MAHIVIPTLSPALGCKVRLLPCQAKEQTGARAQLFKRLNAGASGCSLLRGMVGTTPLRGLSGLFTMLRNED